MAQDTQIIDLRRSYIPIDPNAFPITELDTTGEDNPEGRVPVLPYDGYNFMPTPQGYASFFGINVKLNLSTLAANVDDIFMIQTITLDNILIALTDTGIWTKSATSTGAWTHLVTLAAPASGSHLNWSKCVIENEVFVYRQGDTGHYKATPTNSYVFTIEVPTFLNMAGQLGIFKAGGRLGYWDSLNSTSWSALGVTQDFVPSVETLAGNTVFQDIVGKIVTVLQNSTGFIIYCTKSIVQVDRNPSSPMLWRGKALFNNNGISYREEACVSEPDITHFAFTTQGLVQISGTLGVSGTVNIGAEFISPEISTYMKEARQPVYLKLLNGRYLFFTVLDPRYVSGLVSFNQVDFPSNTLEFAGASFSIAGSDAYGNTGKAMLAAQAVFDQRYLYDAYGYTAYTQATVSGRVPIWEDHLATTVTVAVLNAYKAAGTVSGNGSPDYFDGVSFANGNIARIDSGNESFIPATARNLQLVGSYAAINTTIDNDGTFFDKQDWLWYYEQKFFDDWKEAIYRKSHVEIDVVTTTYVSGVPSNSSGTPTVTPSTFGPYLDISYFSEDNKYYGVATKSAWLQRSLTKGIKVQVDSIVQTDVTAGAEQTWSSLGGGNGRPGPYTYAALMALDTTAYAAAIKAILDGAFPASAPWTVTFVALYDRNAGAPNGNMYIEFKFDSVTFAGAHAQRLGSFIPQNYPTAGSPGTPGLPIYAQSNTQRQRFSVPRFISVDYPTCTYKQIGFTKIKGHGHYTSAGAFVVDNATPETADNGDVCTTSPAKKKQAYFQLGNGSIRPIDNYPPTFGSSVVISGTTYTFPTVSVTFPSGSILLQQGSIEPIYPTFLGSFVFDIHTKKWGKHKGNYKRIFDYFPINSVAGDGIVPYDIFLPKAAILAEDGFIYLFDQFPGDSYIVFGKIGFYRRGFTNSEEVRIVMRDFYTGSIQLQGSLNSGEIEPLLSLARPYTAVNEFVAPVGSSARWFNIKIEGSYDLIALEFRGRKTGRR